MFASHSGVFSLFSPLNIYISLFFCLPVLSLLPVCCRAPLVSSSTLQARCHPCPSLLPSACPPFLPAVCPVVSCSVSPWLVSPWLVPFCLLCALWLPAAVCPLSPLCPRLARREALRRPSVCVVSLWRLPLLVHRQAQDGVTVWADAPRICPRPCLPLPMCCRVSRCLFRGFRVAVSVCVLLPCVVWWQ